MSSTPPLPPAAPASPYRAGAPLPRVGGTPKSFLTTWILSYLLGILGVDRFYLGKVGTGILKLLTLGGYGVWWLIDLILILSGSMRDKAGRPLDGYERHKKVAWIVTGALVALGIILGAIGGGTAGGASRDAVPPAVTTQTEKPAEPSKTPDTRRTVPALAGKSVADARTLAQADGFVLVVPSGTGDDWVIDTQSARAGSMAYPGSEISITATAPKPVLTVGQQNALDKAQSYLTTVGGFSRTSLIKQLEFEGFTPEDSTFAADNVGADWNAQAAEKAKSYMQSMSFSKSGLANQLQFEGFTPEQITAGLAAVGY